jgi:hypothetical protein
VDHPVDPRGLLAQRSEYSRIGQGTQLLGEAQPSVAEVLSQLAQELLAEAAAEEAHGKKEGRRTAPDPAGTIEGDPSAGHDAMQVRVQV